jgi:glycosyltransferase involved in cell wall biosynthesis
VPVATDPAPNKVRVHNCTIGIAARNEEHTLETTLAALFSQNRTPGWQYHILVVVNGSTDRTLDVAVDFGLRHFGQPEETSLSAERWEFATGEFRYSVHELAEGRKSLALNFVHAAAEHGLVILFDADVSADQGVVDAICRASVNHPEYGAIGPRYAGKVAVSGCADSTVMTALRLWISGVLNRFDRHCPRLDGKCLSYRHDLIAAHPSLIAVDMWLEGQAWQSSAGCIYLNDVCVRYCIPGTWDDLVAQHRRYARSVIALARECPGLIATISEGRRRHGFSGGSPSWLDRFVGWMFFASIRLSIKRSEGNGLEEWEPIRSTKQGVQV